MNISVTINGKKIATTNDKTILDVVNEFELDKIPTLCHDKRIEPFSSCYLCAVQIEGMAKLVPSCSTVVNEGMVIHTNNDTIRKARKTAIELLMSNHYADCIGPCINNCPAHVDAQGYISLIAMGKHREALQLIKSTNPLPLSIGRVCVRNCEEVCRRCYVEEPVAINYMKRFVADRNNNEWVPDKKASNGKKVAVVGGGPAGLTCAYYLAIEGYSVTIMDKMPKLGGMLRYGIPEYRLPKDVLDSEINWILDLGVEVKNNVLMGKDFSIDSLKKDGFNAIFLSVGAWRASSMGLEGENEIEGVTRGIEFLKEIDTNGIPELKGNVIIVGGGNTAIDAARTSLRCGADSVKIVYRRSLKEMPANEEEIHAAIEEGVDIQFLTNPKRIISENGKLTGIECYKMELVAGKPGERPRPVQVEGSEFIIPCDYLVSAIGQAIDGGFLSADKDCTVEKWGTVKVDKESMLASIPGVFSGGDVVNGALTAISAIADGKRAADSIDESLQTGNIEKKTKKFYSFKSRFGDIPKSEFTSIPVVNRTKMIELPILERKNFKEVELGLDEQKIHEEAMRCLECGCSEYFDCAFRKYADEFEIDLTSYLGDVRKFKVDNRHPLIAFDPNKCINCGKCVRICSSVLKITALGFVNRGFKTVVKPAMEKPLLETTCITCGNCIDICPTGAISENWAFRVPGTLTKTNHESICNFCSVGCSINFKVINDEFFYVSNATEEIVDTKNDGFLCLKGRFGHRYLNEKNKIESPSIKIDGVNKNVGFNEAFEFSAKKINEIIAKYGSDSVAVFASPKLSNEELYLLQKFTRAGLKNNNISSLTNLLYGKQLDSLNDVMGATVSTVNYNDLKSTDVVFVMNADLNESNMIIKLKINEAQKRGAKFIFVSSGETRVAKDANLWIKTKLGTNTVLLSGLMHELNLSKDTTYDMNTVLELTGISEVQYKELIGMVNPDKNLIFVYNLDSNKEKSVNDLKAAYNFLSLSGRMNKEANGMLISRDYSNSNGLQDMGVTPDYLPGYVKLNDAENIEKIGKLWNTNLNDVFKASDIKVKLDNGTIKAVLVFGENPYADADAKKLFAGVEFLMLSDSFQTETAAKADVVLPASVFIEQTGTYTSCDTMVQKADPVFNKKIELDNYEIINKLGSHFNDSFNYESIKQVRMEIHAVNRLYFNLKPGLCWNKTEEGKSFFAENSKTDETVFEKDVTVFNAEKTNLMFSENFFFESVNSKLQ